MSDIEDWLKFLESPEGYFVERIDGQGSVCNIKSENEFYSWLNR